jgi:NAD(P)-dependent dehydrogenase (short-subunit alcohol dehydrogenase family)
MFELTGKTALITGATGTIGGTIARVLHAQGATVAISGTRRESSTLSRPNSAIASMFCRAILRIRLKPMLLCRARRRRWGSSTSSSRMPE